MNSDEKLLIERLLTSIQNIEKGFYSFLAINTKDLTSDDGSRLLGEQPQLAEHCDWSKLIRAAQ